MLKQKGGISKVIVFSVYQPVGGKKVFIFEKTRRETMKRITRKKRIKTMQKRLTLKPG